MAVRGFVQRAFPYLVVAGVGFGLGYVIVLLFIIPANVPSFKSAGQADTAVKAGPTPSGGGSATTPDGSRDSTGAVSGDTTSTPQVPEIPVVIPDLAGMSYSDARPVLESLQLQIIVQHDTSSMQPENTILQETPVAGTQVPSGSTITIVVSHFPPGNPTGQDSQPHDSARLPSQIESDTLTS